jgi:2-methylisocitrate lyase-like PEP mutase family enzyme
LTIKADSLAKKTIHKVRESNDTFATHEHGDRGKTPIFNATDLGELGYGIVLYANVALQGAVAGMQKALTVLRDEKEFQESSGLVATFAERQLLVNKPEWDALEKRYT